MGAGIDIERRLRYQFLGFLHAGRLRPGDRLPSIRQVVQETGADHRAVARAYHALAEEGLVEIRPGSGVYVTRAEPTTGLQTEVASWLTSVLLEGWHRHLRREQIGDLVARCASVRLRCACIESNQDHLVALSSELEQDFSFDVVPILVSPDAEPGTLDPGRLGTADLVVSTVFHVDAARAASAEAGRPFVLLNLDPGFAAEIDRRLQEGPVTAVSIDPAFAARGEAYFAVTGHRGRVRYVLADRLEEEGISPADPSVLLTCAARRFLGMEEYHLLPPPLRVISAESARELAWRIVAAALEPSEGSSGEPASQSTDKESPASRS